MVYRSPQAVVDVSHHHIEWPLVMVVNGEMTHHRVGHRNVSKKPVGRMAEQAQPTGDPPTEALKGLWSHLCRDPSQPLVHREAGPLPGPIDPQRQTAPRANHLSQNLEGFQGSVQVVEHSKAVREVEGGIAKRWSVHVCLNHMRPH